MKLIKNYRSSNFNKRKKGRLLYIIIHYTALKNYEEALLYLCDKRKKVSSHFLINQNGNIYNLVNLNKRAWHAGISYWEGNKDINSMSIGIELDFSSNKENNNFSKKMIKSLIFILKKIKKKYNIKNQNILAHSDIAPLRKKDPGIKFPWKSFSSANILSSIYRLNKSEIKIIEDWFHNYNFKSKKQRMILALSIIGYDTRQVYKNNKLYNKLIQAYKIRYPRDNSITKNQSIYYYLIQHLFNFMLTKN